MGNCRKAICLLSELRCLQMHITSLPKQENTSHDKIFILCWKFTKFYLTSKPWILFFYVDIIVLHINYGPQSWGTQAQYSKQASNNASSKTIKLYTKTTHIEHKNYLQRLNIRKKWKKTGIKATTFNIHPYLLDLK